MNNTMFTTADHLGTNNKEENKMNTYNSFTTVEDFSANKGVYDYINKHFPNAEEGRPSVAWGRERLEERFEELLAETSSLEYWVEIGGGDRHISPEDYHQRMGKLSLEMLDISDALKAIEASEASDIHEDVEELKASMKRDIDQQVSQWFAEGKSASDVVELLKEMIELFKTKGNGAFSAIYMNDVLIPELQRFIVAEEQNKKQAEAQERFEKMEEQLDDIKETMREHSRKVVEEREEKANFKQKVSDAVAGKSVASETDKVLDKAEEVFTQSSKVVKSATKKTVEVAKKAERKFGRFVGEFLAKSAMEGARKNRQ